MNYAIYDGSKGYILLEETFFENNQENIISTFQNFLFHSREDGFVKLQTTTSLGRKQPIQAYVKGELKEDTSCTFCKHRLKCITTDWRCIGYSPVERFVVSEEKMEDLFKQLGLKMIYAKVV